MSDITPGLVCGHHHLYSALARGMPAPPAAPTTFVEILEQIWWRLDVALDLEMIKWSAMLGALEALESGTTAIVDHHESPLCIEGSLSVIAEACAEVGVRSVCCYGATDRHGSDGAARGLEENSRFLSEGGRGMVGLHAAFTVSDVTIEAAADMARSHGVGVHVHVAEGAVDSAAVERLGRFADESWLIVHGVHRRGSMPGTLVHNPRSNMNNGVGYARPRDWPGRVVIGSDGIGADMLEEFRLAYVRAREFDLSMTPSEAWGWLEAGWDLVPEARGDVVRWSYGAMDDPWCTAFTTGIRALNVWVDGSPVLVEGIPTRVDPLEVRARAAEQAARLFARL